MSDHSTVAFYTLGCKLNFSETSTIARDFEQAGFRRVSFKSKADVYVINTCSVTAQAEKKCRQAITKIHHQHPEAVVAVVGCYAQLRPEALSELPGVGVVVGAQDKMELLHYVAEHLQSNEKAVYSCSIGEVNRFEGAYSAGDRTRSFLKVQDGCDYGCSYCTIPLARGKSRNPEVATLVAEAEKIAASGTKEIVLTGVNTGDFGKSTGESFLQLITALEQVSGIARYRISSIEPNLLSNEIIEWVSGAEKFLPHFHIPLQSGSNRILGLMRRRYRSELFAERCHKIKAVIPDAFIGVDVITGFPGETESDFQQTCDLLRSLDIAFLHVFQYSARPGTVAAGMQGKVQAAVIKERSRQLHEISDEKHRSFYEKFLGSTAKVLFEHQNHNGKIAGFTENYIKVELPFSSGLANQIKRVELCKINDNGTVTGRLI